MTYVAIRSTALRRFSVIASSVELTRGYIKNFEVRVKVPQSACALLRSL